MSTDDIIGIAILAVLAPAFVGYVVWLVAIRPRRYERAQRERAAVVARALGLEVLEPGLVGGMRDGWFVEISFRGLVPLQRGVATTHCRARVEPPFDLPFAVVTPAVRGGAGWTERFADDVGIGGSTDEARALAATLAPIVQTEARTRPRGVLRVELDRVAAHVVLGGTVLDPAPLEAALALATKIARATRAATGSP